MDGTRVARAASAAVVAGIAAWSSYSHMIAVALRYGERMEVAVTLPLSVDGMLVVASVAMVDDRRHRRRVRPAARVAFAFGVAASVAANIAAAQPHLGSRVIAAWPAVALLLVVEILSRPGRTQPTPVPEAATVRTESRPSAGADPESRSSESDVSVPSSSHPLSTTDELPPTVRSVAAPDTEPGAETDPAPPVGGRRPARVTRELALAILAAEPNLPRIEVAARVGVSPRRLREVLGASR